MHTRRTSHAQPTPGRSGGFSLLESLVLVIILGIIGAAAGRALQALAKTPGQTDAQFQVETCVISKLEAIRAMPFDTVLVGTPNATLSDTVWINNIPYARTVNVALVDANGDGSPDLTMKQVSVSVGGQSVTTMISR